MEDFESLKSDGRADKVAAALSSLCLAHCLALPFVLAMLPGFATLPQSELHGAEWIHWLLLGLAVPFSFFALRKGYLLHGNASPSLVAAVGFAFVTAGALAHGMAPIEQILTLLGGAVVATAHWQNWRARLSSRPDKRV